MGTKHRIDVLDRRTDNIYKVPCGMHTVKYLSDYAPTNRDWRDICNEFSTDSKVCVESAWVGEKFTGNYIIVAVH